MPQKERLYRKLRDRLLHQPNKVSEHLLAYTSFLSVKDTKNKRLIFVQLWFNIVEKKASEITAIIRRSLIAASILIMSISIIHENAPQCYETSHSIQKIILPDGSVIYLNKNSKAYYQPGEWGIKRTVKLQGEAFFEVEKGPDFEVETALANIKVLGTSFHVHVSDTTYSLHCYTGKVCVHNNTNHFHQLVFPGEAAIFCNNGWHLTTFKLQNHPAWLSSTLEFSHESLNNVFTTIEKRFGISIMHPDYSDRYFTGTISSNSLDSIMRVICNPMNIKYKLLNKREIEVESHNSSIN